MNTKDFKAHVSKIFVAIGGIATTTVSCQMLPYSVNSENFAKDQDEGLSLLPVSIYLSEEINFNGILEFANDVISKPDFANKFYENPEDILNKYGIEEFDKDSPQVQIILASADPDVLKAIKDKDFKAYLQILEEKNYLQSDFIKQMNHMMDDDFLMTKSAEQVQVAWGVVPIAVLAIAIAVAVAAVLVYVIGKASTIETLMEDDALYLYVDKSKSLDTLEVNEEEYISEIREFILNAELSDNPETNNNLFQLACGTAEYIIETSK